MARVKIDGDFFRVAVAGGKLAWQPSVIEMFAPQVSQEDVAESQLPFPKRPSITIRDLSEGYGEPEQRLSGPIRKFDRIGDVLGDGVDASLAPDGPVLLGPGLFEPLGGNGDIVRVLPYGQDQGRLFYGDDVYTLEGWEATDIGTLGATLGGQPVSFRGAQSANHWYAPLGASNTPQYSTDNGANWTNVTTDGGFTEALDMAVVDGAACYLYTGRYGTAFRFFTDGGPNPTVLGTIDPIGFISSGGRVINWNDRVVCVGLNEVLILAADRSEKVQNLIPEVTNASDIVYTNGVCVWRGLLWIPTTQGLFAISPDGSKQIVGPDGDGITANSLSSSGGSRGGVGHKGILQAVVGDGFNLYGFFAVESAGSVSNPAWLMKANVTVSGSRVSEIVWFPIVNLGSVNTCYGMCIIRHRQSTFGGQPTKSMLMSVQQVTLSLSNEHLYLVRLPNRGRDPRADIHYRYAVSGTLYNERLNALFPAFSKDWLAITPRCADLGYGVDGSTAVTDLGIQVRYKTDLTPLVSAAPYGYTVATTQGASDKTGVRVDLSGVSAKGFDTAVRFSTSHVTSNQSPQLFSLTMDYRPNPGSVWQHQLVLDLSSASYEDDGSGGYADPLTPDAAYRKLRTLRSKAPFEFQDPAGNISTAFCIDVDPNPSGMPESGYEGAIPMLVSVTLVETKPAEEQVR